MLMIASGTLLTLLGLFLYFLTWLYGPMPLVSAVTATLFLCMGFALIAIARVRRAINQATAKIIAALKEPHP